MKYQIIENTMGVYKPRPSKVLSVLIPLCACGLEGDYDRFKDVAQANNDSPAEATSSGSSFTSSPDDPDSSTTTALPGDDASDSGSTAVTAWTGSEEPGSTSTAGIPTCGDQNIDADEECDDINDPACWNCRKDRLVFVTSETVPGDFAEHAELDYLCNHLADIAGLLVDHQPRFLPWISTSLGGATHRLHHAEGRYVLRNGAVLAESWEALIAGDLLNPPNIDETGKIFDVAVWTGTRPDGTAMPDSDHCENWSIGGFDHFGGWGYSGRTNAEWTQWAEAEFNPGTCGDYLSLYCFEQY